MLIALLVFAPFLFGILASLTGVRSTKIRNGVLLTAVTAELLISLGLLFDSGTFEIPAVFGNGITFTADGFRSVYALIAAFMWFCTAVFSQEYFRKEPEELGRYYFFFLWTLGATEGVMLSGDFMTAFIFFVVLSFTSFTWVIHERTSKAIRAANTYLYIAVIGGLFVFIGILLLKNTVGTLIFSELRDACAGCAEGGKLRIASMCILFGFGAKAGMFPLHVWLPKAHPVAPSPASALLSGMLTKVGIYGILMISFQVMLGDLTFGMLVLILGMITMVLGAVLGLFSNELKRTLACSSMSQIGFILTGIGTALLLRASGALEGAEETTAGVLLYMVNHSLIKLLLFMIAGVVVMNIHRQELNEIQGWGRKHHF